MDVSSYKDQVPLEQQQSLSWSRYALSYMEPECYYETAHFAASDIDQILSDERRWQA
jgi:hypothetical protein